MDNKEASTYCRNEAMSIQNAITTTTAFLFCLYSPVFCCYFRLEQLAALHSGRTPVSDRRTFPVPRSTCSWRVTINVGKPSAIGQPTRPTQPFILSGSINWALSNFIGCVLVAPSGECSRGEAGAVINRYAPSVAAI